MPGKTIKPTFEESLNRLEEIADELAGETGLDQSVELYAEATKLIEFCNKKLNTAQTKIEKITESGISKD